MSGLMLRVEGKPSRKVQRSAAPDALARRASDTSGWYCCARCAGRLAHETWVLASNAERPLVFANPMGSAFELILVSKVVGVAFEPHATLEHTWFQGYAWRIGWCERCGGHVGWHFGASPGRQGDFVGLSRAALKFMNGS